jgi:hypothetical protein
MSQSLYCFFYALTARSLYCVSDDRDPQGCPIVRIIATKRKDQAYVGDRLRKGSHVGIAGTFGIILYNPNPDAEDRLPEKLDIAAWGDHTSGIVGLFFGETEARKALETSSLGENDPRFWKSSARVIEAIGNDHPVFVVSGLNYKYLPLGK